LAAVLISESCCWAARVFRVTAVSCVFRGIQWDKTLLDEKLSDSNLSKQLAQSIYRVTQPIKSSPGQTSTRQERRIMETRSPEEIEESTERLLQDLKAVVADGEELLRAGATELGERGAVAREKLQAALEIAKDTQRKIQQRATQTAETTDRLIRQNPYQALGIAFFGGMLFGIILTRR